MVKFSLKWLFVGMAAVALAITAVQNANLTWLFITVIGTMLALQRLAQLRHFTGSAVSGFWIMGLFCLWLTTWLLQPVQYYKGEPVAPYPCSAAILFCIGLLLFVCVRGSVLRLIHGVDLVDEGSAK